MKIKSIKRLIKTLIFITIISLSMIITCFADDNVKNIQDFCNKYNVQYNGKIDKSKVYKIINSQTKENGDIIINYSNNSWYIYNLNLNKYTFKPIESDKELEFNTIDELSKCTNEYKLIKENENPFMLSDNNGFTNGIGTHSNKIYTNDLKTDEDLKNYAEQWLKDNYSLTLNVPINFNNIPQGINKDVYIGGQCLYSSDKSSVISIKIDSELSKSNRNFESEKVLVHELTHYALNKLGKNCKDYDEDFKEECVKNGGNTDDGEIGILHSCLKCTL